jgi:hypothetical protein
LILFLASFWTWASALESNSCPGGWLTCSCTWFLGN